MPAFMPAFDWRSIPARSPPWQAELAPRRAIGIGSISPGGFPSTRDGLRYSVTSLYSLLQRFTLTRLLGGASAFLLIISAYGWQRERQRGPATRPWDTYEVILWQAGQPVPSVKPALRAQRLREMGFTAEQ